MGHTEPEVPGVGAWRGRCPGSLALGDAGHGGGDDAAPAPLAPGRGPETLDGGLGI